MLESIINIFKINYKKVLMLWLIALAFLLIFTVMAIIIINSGEDTYVTFGTYVALSVFGLGSTFMGINYFSTSFDDALKMGETRTRYLISMSIFVFMTTVVSLMLMNLIKAAESSFYQMLYPGLPQDSDFPSFNLSISVCILLALVFLIVSMISGAMVNAFGRGGFFAIYILCCFSPVLIPFIGEKFPALSQFVVGLFELDVWYKPVILAAVILSVFSISFAMLKRHSVNG